MDPKLSVSTDNELLRIGADIVQLNDASSTTYKTDDLGEFIRYAANFSGPGSVPLLVYYNATEVHLYRSFVLNDPRSNDPMAICTMNYHPRLKALMDVNGKKHDADDFETLLRKLRRNMDERGKELFDNLTNLSLAKTTKVDRKKDGKGNYTYIVSRESSGKEDFTPPDAVSFSVPFFIGVTEEKELEFDFRFDFQQKDGDVNLQFTLESLNITEDLIHSSAEVLANALAVLDGVPCYRGTLSRKIADDSWSKKINGINL